MVSRVRRWLGAACCWIASLALTAVAQPDAIPAENAAPVTAPRVAELPVKLSPAPYYIGTPVSATIVVPGAVVRPQLELRSTRDLEIRIFDANPLPESSAEKGFVFRLNLLPKTAGTLQVPAMSIAGGTRRSTSPFSLDVLEPEPAHDMSLTATLSETSCYVGQPLTLEVTWALGSDVSAIHAVDLRVPLMEHPDYRSRDFATLPKDFGTPVGLPVSNGRIIGGAADRTLRFRRIIVPQKPGKLTLTGAAVLCSVSPVSEGKRPGLGAGFQYAPQYDNQFFSDADKADAKRFYVRSSPITVRVRPLPEKGKPADFSGIVGAFALESSITPSTAREGEPVTLTVRVRDYAYPEVIDLPAFGQFAGFRGRFRIPADRAMPLLENTDKGIEKIFRQSIRPVSSGVEKVPVISIPFFDPVKRAYGNAIAPEIPLRVVPHTVATGFDAILSDGSRLKNFLVAKTPAIGPNFSRADLVRPTLATWVDTAAFWWVTLLVPPLSCVIVLTMTRRRRCRRESPSLERAQWAYADFQRETRGVNDTAELTRALHRYLYNRLGTTVITFGAVEGRLRKHRVPETEIQRLREIFAAGDVREFSPQAGSNVLPVESVRAVVAAIETALAKRDARRWSFAAILPWVGVALVCSLVIPVHASSQTDAISESERLFLTGITQQFDNPEVARDAFEKASAGYEYLLRQSVERSERGKLHYNAGAARFFAGDFGRAVYHFRKAAIFSPAEPRVRSALAYVRAQQSDSTSRSERGRMANLRVLAREFFEPSFLKLLFAGVYGLIWILVTAVIAWPNRLLRRLLFTALLGGGVVAGILGVRAAAGDHRREGVVLEAERVARKGPAAIYESAFETPIHAGLEFRVVGRRNDWLEILVPGTRETCWIPVESAALFAD